MAAEIIKNSVVDAERQVDLIVSADGYGPAPVETNFIALGILFVPDPANLPHYKLGTGTCVNKRIPVTIADDVVESVDTGADTLTLTAHNYKNLDGPLTAPGIDAGNQFWVIWIDANTIAVASSLADAIAGTREPLAGTETGTTISDSASTMRGLPGKFTYTFTQTETNNSLTEISVLIEGSGFTLEQGGGAYSSANKGAGLADIWSVTTTDGLTNQQKLTLAACFAGAKFTKVGSVYTWRKLDDSGDAFTMTVVAGGRTVFTPIDLD